MRRSLLSLAVLGLTMVSAPGFAGSPTPYVSPFSFTMPVLTHGPFFISEVCPVTPQGYGDIGTNPSSISDNRCFMGTLQGAQNVSVTPGVFCLGPTVNFRLDVNAFTTCRPGYGSPYVQSVRLVKTIPGSQKVPFCYPPAQYFQFGPAGIRTWWALKFTQPGTTFTLEVTTRCLLNANKRIPEIHIDRWIWEVNVDTGTLGMVVDMLHSSALSTMEFPCIADERVYHQLRDLASALHASDTLETGVQRITDVQNVIFAIEGFVLTECVYGDFVAPSFARGTAGFDAPPGNLPSGTRWAPSQFMGNLAADSTIQGGILDTTENPCCCKLIADVEFLFNVLTG